MTDKLPFPKLQNDFAVALKILESKGQDQLSYERSHDCPSMTDTVWALLKACWSINPSRRPTAACVGLVLDLIVGLDAQGSLTEGHVLRIMERMRSQAVRTEAIEVKRPPYPCKWFACVESFHSLEQCISHECHHFLNDGL